MNKLRQIKNLKYIMNKYGKELWIQICGHKNMEGANCFFWSGLIPIKEVDDILSSLEWEHEYKVINPGFVRYGESKIEYKRFSNSDYEPLIFVRDYPGIKKSNIEISEEFRHFYNLYYDSDKYYEVKEDGTQEEVVKVEGENVLCKLSYLKRYVSAKQMAVALYFDIRYDSSQTLDMLGLEKMYEKKIFENGVLHFQLENNRFSSSENNKSYSVIRGKKLIIGGRIENSKIWPFEDEKKFEEFIIGCDADGEEVHYSADYNKLSNYYEKKTDVPYYLTPVYFSKDVLTKYYANPDKYEVQDGHIRCDNLWLLQIDNHHEDYVMVYLGDLGRDLPSREQLYWKSFNIISDGGISKAKFERDFLVRFTEPQIIDLKFKHNFKALGEEWKAKYGWNIYLEFTEKDQYNFDHLRLPVANSQVEFDGQVLSLVKTIIDSINEKALGKKIKDKENLTGSISKLEKYLEEQGVKEYEVHIKFLRNLQSLRSTGSGHRKGKTYELACENFKLKEKGFLKTFKTILESADLLINYLREQFI